MNTTSTEQLAGFAAELTYDALPASAREQALFLLLDSVACALSADFGDETEIYGNYAKAVGGVGDSTVIGSTERLSELGAALFNAYQITATTVCDTYVPAHVHITPEVVPAAFAVAERGGVTGRDLLTAVAAGSEVAVRVAAGINYSVAGRLGWHMPGIVGPFGAAAAVGRLRGLDPLQMRNAFGLAGSQSAGTWASWGTPTVKFHQSRGALSGLMAGLLAAEDFKSSADILGHADGGIFKAYSDGGTPERAVADLGERYEMEQISLRLWPGGTPLQPTLTAVFDLIAENRPAFADIDRVRIEVSPDVYDEHVRFAEPTGKFEALLSYPFTVAASLRDGRFWLDSVDAAVVGDPELRRFMRDRMELAADAGLTRASSRVEIRMRGGGTLAARADAAKGTPDNRVTIDDLRAKFECCADGRMAQADADELLDLLVRLDEIDNIERLFGLLGSVGQRSRTVAR